MNEEIRSIAEQCSKPKSGVHELALLQLRPYVESFLDASWLSTELKKYEDWALKNSDPFLQRALLHTPPRFNMLAASIWAARDWEKIHKDDPSFRIPAGAKWLVNIACSLAVLELKAGQLLDQQARSYLRKRLQHTENLWGAIHEIHAFAFFIRQGAEVQPHFLKAANPEEITLQWRGVDIPVQCKAKLPGSGRVISQRVFISLAGSIARDARTKKRKLLVKIGSTAKIRNEDIEFLRRQVSSGIGSRMGPALVTNNGRTFTVRSQPLSGQFTVKTIRDYLSSFDFHVGMVIGEPVPNRNAYDVVAIVGIEANLREKPWNSLWSSIEKAAKQLKGGRPGIVAIHYADPINDFETLRPDARPLTVTLGGLLSPRPHIGAVILTSEPDLQLPGAGDPGRVRIYHKKPWPFPDDFLVHEGSI
jgi:hypothetical protein